MFIPTQPPILPHTVTYLPSTNPAVPQPQFQTAGYTGYTGALPTQQLNYPAPPGYLTSHLLRNPAPVAEGQTPPYRHATVTQHANMEASFYPSQTPPSAVPHNIPPPPPPRTAELPEVQPHLATHVKLPEFDGKSDVRGFFSQFEIAAQALGSDNPHLQKVLLIGRLTGSA
jgi:hypothetical protein